MQQIALFVVILYEQQQQKKYKGNQMQEFSLLPGKSHRMYFIPPTRSDDGTYEILLRKNLVLASLVILAGCAWGISNLETSRRKVGI